MLPYNAIALASVALNSNVTCMQPALRVSQERKERGLMKGGVEIRNRVGGRGEPSRGQGVKRDGQNGLQLVVAPQSGGKSVLVIELAV